MDELEEMQKKVVKAIEENDMDLATEIIDKSLLKCGEKMVEELKPVVAAQDAILNKYNDIQNEHGTPVMLSAVFGALGIICAYVVDIVGDKAKSSLSASLSVALSRAGYDSVIILDEKAEE